MPVRPPFRAAAPPPRHPPPPPRQWTPRPPPPPGDKYHVEMCEPAIPNMEELLAQLNTGNDFSRFVRDMRKGFKALVA